jgi:uncharacterized protein YjiS (DUF1127 family)
MITDTPSGARYSASLSSSLSAAAQAIAAMFRFRRTLKALEALDDRQLRDIGLTRGDLTDLRMASSADAVTALARIRFRR